jgi:hypothetical protein
MFKFSQLACFRRRNNRRWYFWRRNHFSGHVFPVKETRKISLQILECSFGIRSRIRHQKTVGKIRRRLKKIPELSINICSKTFFVRYGDSSYQRKHEHVIVKIYNKHLSKLINRGKRSYFQSSSLAVNEITLGMQEAD